MKHNLKPALVLALFFSAVTPARLAHSEPESTNAPSLVSPPAPGTIVYELRDLKPAGITQYSSSGDTVVRQYFEFNNEQGKHHIIYEEVANSPPSRTVTSLRDLARMFEGNCSIDIECSSKAFCTGDCRNMYYETANAPGDAYSPDRNKCKVQYFSCEKTGASSPAPAPAAGSP